MEVAEKPPDFETTPAIISRGLQNLDTRQHLFRQQLDRSYNNR
jgi:hypothetical protein